MPRGNTRTKHGFAERTGPKPRTAAPRKAQAAKPKTKAKAKHNPYFKQDYVARLTRVPHSGESESKGSRTVGSSTVPITKSTSSSLYLELGNRGVHGQSIRATGVEYITTVTVPSGEVANTIYYNRRNNCAIPRTRLALIASIFQRWHPRKYTYMFVSSQPATTPGTLVFSQDPDPTTVWVSGETGVVGRMRTATGSQMKQTWQHTHCELPSSKDYTSLWTVDNSTTVTDSDRLDLAGQYLIAAAAPTGLAAGTTLGIIELHYDIEFYVPRLTVTASVRQSNAKFSPAMVESVKAAVYEGKGILAATFDTLAENVKDLSVNLDNLGTFKEMSRKFTQVTFNSEAKDEKGVRTPTTSSTAGGVLDDVYGLELLVYLPPGGTNKGNLLSPFYATVYHGVTWYDGEMDISDMKQYDVPGVGYCYGHRLSVNVSTLFQPTARTGGWVDLVAGFNPVYDPGEIGIHFMVTDALDDIFVEFFGSSTGTSGCKVAHRKPPAGPRTRSARVAGETASSSTGMHAELQRSWAVTNEPEEPPAKPPAGRDLPPPVAGAAASAPRTPRK